MTDDEWKTFFEVCGETLGRGSIAAGQSGSWCSWTTFGRLGTDAGYWRAPLPNPDELGSAGIADGGTWGQPFLYRELAHVIVPRRFEWETVADGELQIHRREQNIDELSQRLEHRGIEHQKTELALDIKLF